MEIHKIYIKSHKYKILSDCEIIYIRVFWKLGGLGGGVVDLEVGVSGISMEVMVYRFLGMGTYM
jgi:hypothetical protein